MKNNSNFQDSAEDVRETDATLHRDNKAHRVAPRAGMVATGAQAIDPSAIRATRPRELKVDGRAIVVNEAPPRESSTKGEVIDDKDEK